MGNKTVELMKENKDVLFAYEEAIGFMCGTKVLDKDGISAGVRVAELSAYLEMLGLTLSDKLQEIYIEYVYDLTPKATSFHLNVINHNVFKIDTAIISVTIPIGYVTNRT